MLLSTMTETTWNGLHVAVESCPHADRTERVAAVLGLTNDGFPRVDEDTLTRYFTYLSANLSWPNFFQPIPKRKPAKCQMKCKRIGKSPIAFPT